MRISLLIPTRERAETLRATLRNVCTIDDPDLEIIISDNASTDETPVVIARAGDPRIRAVRTSRRVSQRQNFEHAIAAASGEYLMMIGDDDAVLSGQWPLLRTILAQKRPDALSWPVIFYQWPGAEKRGGGGRLRLSRKTLFGPLVERTSAEHLASIGQLERSREDLSPKLYHGVLSRRVIEALRARSGLVIGSGQIDAYLAAAVLPFIERYLYLRHPITILGMGPKSGGSSIGAQHRPGDKNDSARLVAEEAEGDPVSEPLTMPFPALGFYLLNGYEQANRLIFEGGLELDHKAYISMILDQLVGLDLDARQYGLDLLHQFAARTRKNVELNAYLLARATELMSIPPPRHKGAPGSLIRRFESLSLIEPGRIGIDLKPRGLAEIDGAARMADFLIGSSNNIPSKSDAARRWWNTQKRAFGVIFSGLKP